MAATKSTTTRSYKTFGSNDVSTTKTLLHENIPITGSIISGTYTSDGNIKNYSHGMFQTVYDYPYLSSSANHIFDITAGYSPNSGLSSSANTLNAKKINIYNQMAQLLFGHDSTGSIREIDDDGDLISGGAKIRECCFFNFSRLLMKDEIKKGSFQLELGVGGAHTEPFGRRILVTDYSGSLSTPGFFDNSPAGEYGILFATGSATDALLPANQRYPVGLLFYQAGIAVLSGSAFVGTTYGGIYTTTASSDMLSTAGNDYFFGVLTGSSISGAADAIRHRIYNLQFHNTTELNSLIYHCRAHSNEFNYSANPSYLDSSGSIRVKTTTQDDPRSYITTVGLYSTNNELLAVGKLSEPLLKKPGVEHTVRVRLDF